MALNSCSLSIKEKPASGGFFAHRCESRLERVVDANGKLATIASGTTGFLKLISTVKCIETGALAQTINQTKLVRREITHGAIARSVRSKSRQAWGNVIAATHLGTLIGLSAIGLQVAVLKLQAKCLINQT